MATNEWLKVAWSIIYEDRLDVNWSKYQESMTVYFKGCFDKPHSFSYNISAT